jgi:glycerol uptake facilitator-like aquaporin
MQLIASLIAMLMCVIAFEPQQGISVASELVLAPNAKLNLARAFCMEVFLSFILVYVIFAVAFDTVDNSAAQVKIVDEKGAVQDSKHRKNLTIYTTSGSSKAGFAPLSIGLTLGFLCFVGGSVSGGAFNPARAFGPGIMIL